MAGQKTSAKELGRFKQFYKDAPEKKKTAVLELIRNALFMEEQLKLLQEEIREKGCVTEYQNGENQWGTKKSPEVDVYNTMIKNYVSVVKQLVDVLPEAENAGDELTSFLAGGAK